jgi:hypothetical protein
MGAGEERGAVPQQDTNYMGHSHDELKNWTDQGQPGDADGLGQTWNDMGSGLNDAAEQLMIAVFGSESGWTGQAADAMRAQLQKVADWSLKTGDSFTKASQAFVKQGESVGSAKTAMPEPVKYDPGEMIKQAAASGNLVQMAMLPYSMYQQSQASRQAHQQAADVVQKRDTELAAAAQSIPPFEPPPTLGSSEIRKPGPDQPGIPGGPGLHGGGGFVPSGGSGGGGGGGRPGIGGPGGPGGFPGGGQGANGPNGNGRDDQQPPPNVGMPIGTGTSGFAPAASNGGGPGPGPSTSFGGGGGPAAGSGGGFGSGFGGGAFGPPGAGPAAGARPPGGFGPTGSGNPGGMGGGRAAGGRGAGGMGGAGGQKGEGGDDEQHQRPSYLVEPDPDAMFGTDQMTAPPVIGG